METTRGQIKLIEQSGGATLGFISVSTIKKDGYIFKDPLKCGSLLPFCDWRLDAGERAADLAARLPISAIAGLMMYSPHQMVPGVSFGAIKSTYNGESYSEKFAPYELSDQLKVYISKSNVRHVLLLHVKDAKTAAKWNNELQAYAEELPFSLPVNISSDPRHGASASGAEFKSGEGDVSKWPESLGIAATFSPTLCNEFASIAAREYRAMGIATALSPQIDLATEPRWMRYQDTFGPHTKLACDMARAYIDGMQTTVDENMGWGKDSVAAMAKHWPGGGTGEGGRDAHYAFGKCAVYPGNNFEEHLKPFTEAAFKLSGPTGKAAAIMPYYTISEHDNDEHLGNSYNKQIVKSMLRDEYGYNGIVCTDWGITSDCDSASLDTFSSRCYGVEKLTEAERHLMLIENGIDQFGGCSDIAPIMEAYRLGCEKHGQAHMDMRMRESAARLLTSMFRLGLFENPYLNASRSAQIVGNKDFTAEGFLAQLKSIVMVKNANNALPLKPRTKVYIPSRHISARKNFFRGIDEAHSFAPVSNEVIEEYFTPVSTPEEADAAIVFIESPSSDPYDNGVYMPISLQYRPYTANTAREVSLAGGDFRESSNNRSYRGRTSIAANESDLDNIISMRQIMGSKPVIVCLNMHNPTVPAEFEPISDAILIDFGVEKRALFTLIAGLAEPSGLLPCAMPASMETVEAHCEDVGFDIEPYTDNTGEKYDFAFGLSFSGRICDDRTELYNKLDF